MLLLSAIVAILTSEPFSPLSKVTVSRALIVILPPFPCPLVPAEMSAPLVTASDPVVISMSPPLPSLPSNELNKPLFISPLPKLKVTPFKTPSMMTLSRALMVIFPELPFLSRLLEDILPPFVKNSEPVAI